MVVLGLVGPPRSGKRKLAEALSTEHGFRILILGMPDRQHLTVCGASSPNPPLRCTCSQGREQTAVGHDLPSGRAVEHAHAGTANAGCSAAASKRQCNGESDEYDAEEVCSAPEYNSRLTSPRRTLEGCACEPVAFKGNVDALVDYVTHRWQTNFVVLGLTRLHEVQALRKRPFFALVAVEVPLRVRAALPDAPRKPEALLQKLLLEDAVCFASATPGDGENDGVRACMKIADVHVTSDGELETLRKKIRGSWLNEELVRPSWDTYFMRIAFLAATRSNCMKRRVGAILVRRNRIIATGYNGTPARSENCKDGGCARCNNPLVPQGRRLEACECIHAEVNALLEAGRDRAQDSTLYVTCLPCLGCAKLAVQCLVRCVIYAEEYDKTSGALDLFARMGVAVHQYKDLHPGVPGETLAMRCI